MTGGFNPSPQIFGASDNTVYEIFLNALNQGDGDALNHEVDSFVYAENLAAARVLADLWSTNTRLSYQFDPNRMTDFLSRWETILNIIPDPNSTDHARRAVIATKIANYGNAPTQQVILDLLQAILGNVFVSILNNDPNAVVPPGGTLLGAIPGGATVPGGAILADDTTSNKTELYIGYSHVASIAVLVEQPANMSDNQFYNTVAKIDGATENLLPAWTKIDWVRNNSSDTAGFILDDEHNLDNEYFDA